MDNQRENYVFSVCKISARDELRSYKPMDFTNVLGTLAEKQI